jgi:preprotein translocase subunit SecY
MNELVRRIAITIGALLIFRLGSQIPIPLTAISTQSGVLSSGAIHRVSIFSLTLVPYVSAAILLQLVSVVWGRLSALEREGESGRRKIARITLILTLLPASIQAFGVCLRDAKHFGPGRRAR